MELIEIISKHRQTYIKQLQNFFEDRTTGARELLISYNSENSGIWLNMSRMDYIQKIDEDYSITELSPETYINHQPIEYHMGEMYIELHPFFWHSCSFDIHPDLNSLQSVEQWLTKWLDEEGILENDETGLSNAIHSASTPENIERGFTFTIDFGTASLESFLELLVVLQASGVERLTIHSKELIDY